MTWSIRAGHSLLSALCSGVREQRPFFRLPLRSHRKPITIERRMKTDLPSQQTQATLLLCAPLVAAKVKDVAPLSTGQFNDLTAELQKLGANPTDLLEPDRCEEL